MKFSDFNKKWYIDILIKEKKAIERRMRKRKKGRRKLSRHKEDKNEK